MITKKISIAVDGPAGSGKSTISKLVAKKLNLRHINSGTLYRVFGYLYNKNILKMSDYNNCKREFKKVIFTQNNNVFYSGQDITNILYTPEISKLASVIAKNSIIREICVYKLREMANKTSIIMDGRDIASVVLPTATLKIFLYASPEIRATRRLEQNKKNKIFESYNEVLKEIKSRDYNDTHRKHSPLKQVNSSIFIDSSILNISEVVDEIVKLVGKI